MDDLMRRYFKKWDESVDRDLTQVNKNSRLFHLEGSLWRVGMGEFPGHFASNPKGHRVLWSVTWATSRGATAPEQLGWPVDSLTISELIHESLDRAARRPSDFMISTKLMPMVLDYLTGEQFNPEYWHTQLMGIVQQIRQHPDEYSAPWDRTRGDVLMNPNWRPGFPERVYQNVGA